eukprot:CFRG1950T1
MSTAPGQQKMTREQYRKHQELDAARKAGTAPAEIDEEGNMINPHIPQYISQAPWYIADGKAGLKHQRAQKEEVKTGMDVWHHRGTRVKGPAPAKFRKGACENCGAMTHKKKDCMERPRTKGAKWTGDDLQKDEVIVNLDGLEFEVKRDRWNGYDNDDYKEVVDEFARVDRMKLDIKAKEVADEMKQTTGDDDEDDVQMEPDSEMIGYTEGASMPGQTFDAKKRITVRNLRIREDTAKYLRNLDTKSAHYDPKTRSMRGNPYAGTGKIAEEREYVPENFVRYTGDAKKVAQMQLFAWNKSDIGEDVHVQALPTATEKLLNTEKRYMDDVKDKEQQTIIDKYGGAKYLNAPPQELLLGQSESYVEYDRSGNIVKGQEKAIPKTKYVEDVLPNNHRAVWGSYWCDGQWGFSCCHSTVYHSYCVGEAGKRAKLLSRDASSLLNENVDSRKNNDDKFKKPLSLMEEHAQKNAKEKKGKSKEEKGKDKKDEVDKEENPKARMKRIKKILEREEQRERRETTGDERKRKYNSFQGNRMDDVTEEEMEAWKIKKAKADDPMAQFTS